MGSGVKPQILLKLCPEYCKNTVLKNPKNPVDFDYLKRVILEKRIRNSQLSIFQLSMEIFELREKLVDMVRRSINEESASSNLKCITWLRTASGICGDR